MQKGKNVQETNAQNRPGNMRGGKQKLAILTSSSSGISLLYVSFHTLKGQESPHLLLTSMHEN